MTRAHPVAWGFVLGVLGTWAYHHFVRPMPGGGATGGLSGQ